MFPAVYADNNTQEKFYNYKLKKLTDAMLTEIIEDVDLSTDIEEVNKWFIAQIKPRKFTGKQSEELKIEQDFERLCIVLQSYTYQPIKKLTTKEFYSLITYIKEQKPRPLNAV
jgi:hypothetical protein